MVGDKHRSIPVPVQFLSSSAAKYAVSSIRTRHSHRLHMWSMLTTISGSGHPASTHQYTSTGFICSWTSWTILAIAKRSQANQWTATNALSVEYQLETTCRASQQSNDSVIRSEFPNYASNVSRIYLGQHASIKNVKFKPILCDTFCKHLQVTTTCVRSTSLASTDHIQGPLVLLRTRLLHKSKQHGNASAKTAHYNRCPPGS
jgi:hypothetical protein